ncbi:MAG: Rpn family recombination-promoting nuclease/putative transposase [Bacteroidia bacterium]|nr:Rpn family recombination-promoting nuclease/putative transposase [Bacteroidia bacterium]
MMRFVDVKNDIAFRKIFGNEAKKIILISFLNAILAFEGEHQIVDIRIVNPFQLPNLHLGKVSILDLKATDQSGRTFIIEMQIGDLEGFSKRVLYYASKSYSEQLYQGNQYRELKPIIFIGITDFSFSENPNYISRHQIRDVETSEHILKDIEFNFIELPKFNKSIHELNTLADKWIFFIKNAENLSIIPENTDDSGLKLAYEEANIYTWTKDELASYDYVLMREEDERARHDAALKYGFKQGIEQGIEQGIKQGIKQGIEQGKQIGSKQAQIEVAKKMLKRGTPIQIIAEDTGLSIEEIQNLKLE